METLIYTIIGIGMIVWCAYVAQRNNRNVLLSILWSGLFGIFAVIVYYIMGKKEETTNIINENKE